MGYFEVCQLERLKQSWMLGDRNAPTARMFMVDLASRLSNRVQLTSDSHGAYLRAVEGAFFRSCTAKPASRRSGTAEQRASVVSAKN